MKMFGQAVMSSAKSKCCHRLDFLDDLVWLAETLIYFYINLLDLLAFYDRSRLLDLQFYSFHLALVDFSIKKILKLAFGRKRNTLSVIYSKKLFVNSIFKYIHQIK